MSDREACCGRLRPAAAVPHGPRAQAAAVAAAPAPPHQLPTVICVPVPRERTYRPPEKRSCGRRTLKLSWRLSVALAAIFHQTSRKWAPSPRLVERAPQCWRRRRLVAMGILVILTI